MRIDTDILDRFVRKVYRGFDTAGEVEPDIWREVLRVINEATVEGLAMAPEPPAHDRMFYQTLRRSNEVFAAFKVHMMGEDMAAKLIDADGNLKPFDRWRRDIASIASHQVGSWLRTEYDTAVIRAHAAADWREFERNKDILPNLRWMPTTSPEPEGSHRRFWEARLTLPVDDPFWNDHHPGDRWNCKCSLEATDEPVCRPDDLEPATPHRGLENNPGKDGHTFSDNHPYFPKDCSKCPFNKGFRNKIRTFFRNEKKHCYDCAKIDHTIQNTSGQTIVKAMIDNVVNERIARKTACKIYSFTQDEVSILSKHGVRLESNDLYMSDHSVLHALRDFKVNAGKAVGPNELKRFVENIDSYSMYIDTAKGSIVFATNENDKVMKFIVEPNYKLKANGKRFITNSFITAGVIQKYNLDEKKYIKIR